MAHDRELQTADSDPIACWAGLSATIDGLKTAMTMRALRSILRDDRGAALAEAAIVLPVFLLLVGGVYEFGFYLYQEQLATSGVEDAARYLALVSNPTSAISQIEAKNLAVSGSLNGGPSRVSGWSTSDVSVNVDSVDNSEGTYSSGPTVQVVTVSTSFPDPTLGFFTLLHIRPPTISVSHQERILGGSALGRG
jgi:adhesin HecA-like repeat protein